MLYNTSILNVSRYKTNNVIYVENNMEYYMSNNGIAAICGLLAKYLSPNAPNNAGTTLLNAGCNAGALSTG